MSEITFEQIQAKIQSHRDKVKALEDRRRREEIDLEKERAAFVVEGTAFVDGRLLALREQAIGFAEQAAETLAKLPPKPIDPKPEDVSSIGFGAYLAAAEAFPAADKAFREAALAAARPLGAALRGLVHEAGTIRRQAREMGIECFKGVGFLHETERGVDAVRGTALVDFAHVVGLDLISAVALAAERGELTSAQASALAALLRRKPAHAQPAEKPELVWRRMTQLEREREQAAEFAARGGPPLTQTQRDVQKYVDGLGANGGRPMIGGVNLDLDRKTREQREIDRYGFARTGGQP